MNVSLTSELEQLVHEKVESGMYYSASEVIRDALRLLQERDELRQHRIQAVRDQIDRGFEQLERGEGIDGDEFFEEPRQKGERHLRKRT